MPQSLSRILYVEDDEDIAEVAIMTLEELGGFKVRHCASGQEALDTLNDYAPQLVLMDVMMPGMDGPETMRRMRNSPDKKQVPVIFMTAKAQTHEQNQYLDMGAIGVVVKPFDPLGLCDTIRQLWEDSHGA